MPDPATPPLERLEAAKRAFGEAAIEYEMALDSRQAVPEGDNAARQAAHAWVLQQDEVPAAVVQRWMTYDLFLAVVGSSAYDFDEWYERKGFGDAWAELCQKVRETFEACTGEHTGPPSAAAVPTPEPNPSRDEET